MSKKLFVLVQDNCDGSYSTVFTMNEEWIKLQQEKYDNDELDYDSVGCDGDGFHYKVLNVPDECTLQSLGILYDCAEAN